MCRTFHLVVLTIHRSGCINLIKLQCTYVDCSYLIFRSKHQLFVEDSLRLIRLNYSLLKCSKLLQPPFRDMINVTISPQQTSFVMLKLVHYSFSFPQLKLHKQIKQKICASSHSNNTGSSIKKRNGKIRIQSLHSDIFLEL